MLRFAQISSFFFGFGNSDSDFFVVIRNLVTSLIQHEQIKTTLPKARDAARLAEKVRRTVIALLFFSLKTTHM
jgi:ribosomal protein L17